MELTQLYETTLAEAGLGLSFSVLVVPARSFPEGHTPELPDLAGSLELDLQTGPQSVAELPSAIVAVLRGEISQGSRAGEPEYEFAEAVAFDEVIPFEFSPLDARSLASIVTGSGAAGAAVGFVVGAGVPPLLLITVPAGMIVCGAAAGIAAALEQGLKTRLLRRLGVEEDQAAGAAR